MVANKTVFVIDDDARVRESVTALLGSLGHPSRTYPNAEAFLAGYVPGERGIVVADLRMPGMSGLDLLEQLMRREMPLPLVLLTAFARTSATVRAMQAGAVTVIDKPYHDNDLWDAVQAALAREEIVWTAQRRRREIRDRLGALTPEEVKVLDAILAGKANKAIAHELGVAVRTVEKRRHDLMAKLKADSLAALVGMVLEARR